jgi:hypothetical protein
MITTRRERSDAMNNDYGSDRRLLHATLLPAVAAAAVLMTACSSAPSTSSPTGGSVNYQKALAYSNCMRAHNVPNFPDPDAQGNIVASAGAESNSDPAFAAAERACASLNPGGSQAGTAEPNSIIQQDLKLAQCMRAHGVPNFPDPQTRPGVIADWNFSGVNININSPQFQAAERACQSLDNSPTFPGT